MCKVHSKLFIDGFPELYRDGPVKKRTRNGGYETAERNNMDAALAASAAAETLKELASPPRRPVILEGVPPAVVLPPPARRIEAPSAECRPAPRAALTAARARC